MSVGSSGAIALRSSRSSLHRSNESLPASSRSATADAIFMEEFGDGKTEATAARECKCVTAYELREAKGWKVIPRDGHC